MQVVDCAETANQTRNRSNVALLLFALGYNVAHHNSLFGATDLAFGTRRADWIDLATPFLVLGPLAWFLSMNRPSQRVGITAAVGAIVYVEGHGIHLSSNSIGNAATAETSTATLDVIHLWDEIAGHYIWYAGLALVIASCVVSTRARSIDVPPVLGAVGAGLTGLTWATNGLEGGTAIFSLALAGSAIAAATLHPRWGLARPLLIAGSIAAAVLAGYGAIHGGFPQPSAL